MGKFEGLITILLESRVLLARPDNEFMWSYWDDAAEALFEIDRYVSMLRREEFPSILALEFLFATTGPIQEVSLSSGWGQEFLALAERFDLEMAKLAP